MSSRIQEWPLEELLEFSVADEIDTDVVETPMVHPVLIDEVKRTIVRGFARLAFAQEVGMRQVPVVALGQLGPGVRESYLAADTRLMQCQGWSEDDLKAEWERLLEEEGV